MIQPYEVKDVNGHVRRVNAESGEAACQVIANRHQVAVVAFRESRAAEDAVHIVKDPGGVW